jgi:hypothetical protein
MAALSAKRPWTYISMMSQRVSDYATTHQGTVLKGHCPTVDAASISKANTLRLVQLHLKCHHSTFGTAHSQRSLSYSWHNSLSNAAALHLVQVLSNVAILQLERPQSQRLSPYGWCCPLSKVTILQLVTVLSNVIVPCLLQHPSQRSVPYSCYNLTLKRSSNTVGTSVHNCIKSAGCDIKSTAICSHILHSFPR